MSKVNVQTIFGQLDEAQVKTLQDGVKEMSVVMSKMDANKEQLKDILLSIFEETKVPKKIINKIARVYHKKKFVEETTEFNEFETLYGVVVSDKE